MNPLRQKGRRSAIQHSLSFYLLNCLQIWVVPRAISDGSVWKNKEHLTIKLHASIEVLRVHTNGRAFPGRFDLSPLGGWAAIGDVIQTSAQLASSRALPTTNPKSATAFTHVNSVIVPAGCTVNIGIASAIEGFGGIGGGFQIEYVSGPQFQVSVLAEKYWHGSSGHA